MTTPLLELWFANQDALVDLLGIKAQLQLRYLPANSDSQRDMAIKQHALTKLLEQHLSHNAPAELQTIIESSPPLPGTLVAIEQAFHFKRLSADGFIRFHGKLNTDSTFGLDGLLDPKRFPFFSTHGHLSGRQNVFMVATVASTSDHHLSLRALFIGRRTWGEPNTSGFQISDRQVHVQQVDHFANVQWMKAPTGHEMALMKAMREDIVKNSLAQIIGVPFVPKDWGGERSDLTTSSLMVSGRQMSAAWLLKGRSVPGTMLLKHLGSNGDQIERLTTEPAELLVVQHGNAISAPVVNMLRAFAYDMRNPRYYMLMDGHITAMILRDHDLLV